MLAIARWNLSECTHWHDSLHSSRIPRRTSARPGLFKRTQHSFRALVSRRPRADAARIVNSSHVVGAPSKDEPHRHRPSVPSAELYVDACQILLLAMARGKRSCRRRADRGIFHTEALIILGPARRPRALSYILRREITRRLCVFGTWHTRSHAPGNVVFWGLPVTVVRVFALVAPRTLENPGTASASMTRSSHPWPYLLAHGTLVTVPRRARLLPAVIGNWTLFSSSWYSPSRSGEGERANLLGRTNARALVDYRARHLGK